MQRVLQRICENAERNPNSLAIWERAGGRHSFEQLMYRIKQIQSELTQNGFATGSQVVIACSNKFDQIASWLAGMYCGGTVLIVEPWLSKQHIKRIMHLLQPSHFIVDGKTQLWLRLNRIAMPVKINVEHLRASLSNEFPAICKVSHDAEASITFSTGSSGFPKGVVRTYKDIESIIEVLTQGGRHDPFVGPDLSIFSGITLLHLVTGRGSIYLGHKFSEEWSSEISNLKPESFSGNPRFLQFAMERRNSLDTLRKIYIGAAPCEIRTMEKAFSLWPNTEFSHIYGCSEVEPISVMDARESVRVAKEMNYFQNLVHDFPIEGLEYQISGKGELQVKGDHVCSYRYEFDTTSQRFSRINVDWLSTGDHFAEKNGHLILAGRESSSLDTFERQEQIFHLVQTNKCFLHEKGQLLFTESKLDKPLMKRLEGVGVTDVVKAPMVYDKRHGSKILRYPTIHMQNTIRRWWTYFVERSAPLVLLLISSGPVYLSEKLSENPSKIFSILTAVFIFTSLALMRLIDELKDYSTDVVAHPERPLPRGLITLKEAKRGINIGFGVLSLLAAIFAAYFSPFAGAAALTVMLLVVLIRDHFWLLRPFLDRHSVTNTVLHQLVVIPLYALPLLGQYNIDFQVAVGFGFANLGAALTYEISRKLKENIPEAAQSYLRDWGLRRSLSVMFFALLASGMVAKSVFAFNHYFFNVILAISLLCIMLSFVKVKARKFLELFSVVFNLSILWIAIFI